MTKEECEKLVKSGKRVVTPLDDNGFWEFYIDYEFKNPQLCAHHTKGTPPWRCIEDNNILLADAFVYKK